LPILRDEHLQLTGHTRFFDHQIAVQSFFWLVVESKFVGHQNEPDFEWLMIDASHCKVTRARRTQMKAITIIDELSAGHLLKRG